MSIFRTSTELTNQFCRAGVSPGAAPVEAIRLELLEFFALWAFFGGIAVSCYAPPPGSDVSEASPNYRWTARNGVTCTPTHTSR